MSRRRILIIGLDGATFTVLSPLVEKKRLPNIQKMLENGASGTLQSTIPPVTAPAWLALATGMRPERTGVYDFVLRRDADYHLRSASSSSFRGKAVWDYLSEQNLTVGLLNYPLLRPPYPVNGIMAAGIGAIPGEEFTYPASLKDEFQKILGDHYEITLPLEEARYEDPDLLLADLYRVLDKQVKVAEHLLLQREWDMFWVVLSMTDWIQHSLWHHIDKTHPLHEGKKSELIAKDFEAFWVKVDEIVGRLSRIAGPETNIMIISDHGGGPHNQVFRLNAWLEREGYLVRRKTGVLNRVRQSIYRSLQAVALKASHFKILPSALYNLGRRSVEKVKVDVSDQIDLDRTVALDPGHTVPLGGIYINDRVITNPAERELVAGEIIAKLKAWGGKHRASIETWQPDLAVMGKALSNAPDIIVGINNWACEMIKDSFDGPLIENRPYSPRITGSHRQEGVFISSGPDIKALRLGDVSIYDFAPTLFYMFKQAIPYYVDGQVLTEMFDPPFLANQPVKKEGAPAGMSIERTEDYDESEEDAIKKQLQDLGYM
jgi:predicted AlkP superfamily phosphohydrolase/phosphomutase